MGKNETEYAKIIRWYPQQTVYGIRMNVTLPTPNNNKAAAKIGGRNGNGFINFYLAGLGVEAGLSTDVNNASLDNWHWFCNGGSGSNGAYTFLSGQTHSIELSMSGTLINFKVDGEVKRTITQNTKSVSQTLNDARVIVAACDQDYPSTPPKPLDPWNTTMNQVVCSNVQYRNAAGNWVTFSTQPNATAYFPDLPGYPHVGTPQDFVRVVSSGQLIASLKK